MLKKIICLLPLCVAVVSSDSLAASSARMLGANKAVAGDIKTVAVAPKKQNTAMVAKVANMPKKQNNATVAKVADTSAAKVSDSARLPSIGSKIKLVSPIGTSGTGSNAGSAAQRVDTITNVVERGEGPYVEDISIDKNNLVVQKNKLIQAPVRDARGNDLRDTAEIWIVK